MARHALIQPCTPAGRHDGRPRHRPPPKAAPECGRAGGVSRATRPSSSRPHERVGRGVDRSPSGTHPPSTPTSRSAARAARRRYLEVASVNRARSAVPHDSVCAVTADTTSGRRRSSSLLVFSSASVRPDPRHPVPADVPAGRPGRSRGGRGAPERHPGGTARPTSGARQVGDRTRRRRLTGPASDGRRRRPADGRATAPTRRRATRWTGRPRRRARPAAGSAAG